jgi:hypothetical protein
VFFVTTEENHKSRIGNGAGIAALARRLHPASATAPGGGYTVKLNYSWLALFSILFVLLTNGATPSAFGASDSLPVDKITLPAGFEIKLYAQFPTRAL